MFCWVWLGRSVCRPLPFFRVEERFQYRASPGNLWCRDPFSSGSPVASARYGVSRVHRGPAIERGSIKTLPGLTQGLARSTGGRAQYYTSSSQALNCFAMGFFSDVTTSKSNSCSRRGLEIPIETWSLSEASRARRRLGSSGSTAHLPFNPVATLTLYRHKSSCFAKDACGATLAQQGSNLFPRDATKASVFQRINPLGMFHTHRGSWQVLADACLHCV